MTTVIATVNNEVQDLLFSSITFLYYFLPAIIILYFLSPAKFKNYILLLGSLFFYAWGEGKLVLMLAGTAFAGWLPGLFIGKNRGTKYGKIWLFISVATDIAILFYFKYTDFFLGSINDVFKTSIPLMRITLPIGISFYIFQIISYSVDVYKGNVEAERNFFNFATYVTFFPQLIAGPIVRYSDIIEQLAKREHTISNISYGVSRFITGLSKKVIISNALGKLCDLYLNTGQPSVLYCWLYAISFALQIYYDFSGYSDMAIGLGRIFGFDLPENFNYPYISSSVTEFWRRWHITLGSWFRDYVYIPMGGNKKGLLRQMINILVVWGLTGLWHGAAWNFVVWGAMYAALLMIEKFGLIKWLDKHKAFGHVYVIFVTLVGFVIFNATSLENGFSDIAGMLGFGGLELISFEALYYLKSYALIIILAIAGATPVLAKADKQRPVILTILLIVCTACLVDGSFNPFLYFRF